MRTGHDRHPPPSRYSPASPGLRQRRLRKARRGGHSVSGCRAARLAETEQEDTALLDQHLGVQSASAPFCHGRSSLDGVADSAATGPPCGGAPARRRAVALMVPVLRGAARCPARDGRARSLGRTACCRLGELEPSTSGGAAGEDGVLQTGPADSGAQFSRRRRAPRAQSSSADRPASSRGSIASAIPSKPSPTVCPARKRWWMPSRMAASLNAASARYQPKRARSRLLEAA